MDKSEKGDHFRKNKSSDEGKPLKKARYVWEVKGRGYLKSAKGRPSGRGKDTHMEAQSTSDDSDTVISHSGTQELIDRDSTDEDSPDRFPLENSIENEIPVTLVSTQPKNQDYYLQKWQARQIARGFIDNTINSMLENWMDRPFDASELVDDFENDGQVEDDAILMAIRSHGLQSGMRERPTTNNDTASNSNSTCYSSIKESAVYPSSILQESSDDNLQNLQKEQETDSSPSSMSLDTSSSISNPYEADLGDPVDFLNAAVSVAIQKKGLTY
ncbi:hypothetical protein ABEB36_005589 [Hypothenemus hampei]|uniref:Uncharacterized protein n=1 Tax=Hypothenemus hampei TaxID=57062 RepID=A0ABD1F1U9_HYPHA